jgi:hypothetical protein
MSSDSAQTWDNELVPTGQTDTSLSSEHRCEDLRYICWARIARTATAFAFLLVLAWASVAAQTHLIEMETELLISASSELLPR